MSPLNGDAALGYAAHGIYVFPVNVTLVDGAKQVSPIGSWRDVSTRTEATIRAWWAPGSPWRAASVAIDCGKSRLVVVDLDEGNGKNGLANWAALQVLGIPGTWRAATPGGGEHWYYAEHPRRVVGIDSTGKVAKDVDIRGLGGFVIAPPSFDDRGAYRWLEGEPDWANLPVVPDLVIERMNVKKEKADPPKSTGSSDRQFTLEQAAAFIRPALDALRAAPNGQVNATLNTAAVTIGHFVPEFWSRMEAEGVLLDALAATVYDAKTWKAEATIESGISAADWKATRVEPGARQDKLLADILGPLHHQADNQTAASRCSRGEHLLATKADPEADLANARRLVTAYGDELRYVVPWKKWLCWDGARWKVDDTGEAVRQAKKVADSLPRIGPKGGPARTQTAAGIAAMLALAGTEPGIAVSPDQLDSDPYALNVSNGTLDLRTGQLRPHSRGDLLTKVCGAAYHPDARAPEFAAFLTRIQPDEALRDFLGRLFGHALLGKVVEHVLAIFYGVGANGKTTLVEAVTGVFGDYARPIDPGLLIDRGDVHPTGTAALFGLRLAVTHETDAGRQLAEGTVKRLTGGDKITARRMREDFWDFDPSHSIVMHTNHRPIVRGTDEGIWRRLRFVPFTVVIPEPERDGKLPERLTLERDGILTWVVDGYRQWRDRGLAAPEQVTAAGEAFRGESDVLALFIEQRCMVNPHAHVASAALFAAWVDWCRRENVDAGTQTAFSLDLANRGHDKGRTKMGFVWRGIGLYAGEVDE